MGEKVATDESGGDREELVLHVDDRGRVTIPKPVRERLGIEPDSDVPAYLAGSVLTVDPRPSADLVTATAGREDWENSTPTDAGESLFGPREGNPAGSGCDTDRSGSGRADDGDEQ